MKEKIALLFAVLLMFALFTSCIANNNIQEVSLNSAVSEAGSAESEISDISGDELTQTVYHEKLFDVFKDKSVAELEEMFDKNSVNSYGIGHTTMTNTPTRVIFPYSNSKESSLAICSYNKQSGTITYACPDPLCDHTKCIFGYDYMQSVYSGEYIYVIDELTAVKNDGSGQYERHNIIYRTDASGNNAEKLYEVVESDLMYFSGYGGCLYFIEPYTDENVKFTYRLTKIDLDGEVKRISPNDINIGLYTINKDGIYYIDDVNASICFTADEFKTTKKIIENVNYFFAADDYLFYNKIGEKFILYRSNSDGTGEITVSDIIGNNYTYNNGYIYYINGENLNEMWRIKSDGTENKLMFVSETNGQPDEFDWYLIDGTLCYAYCSTCVDEAEAQNNKYNKIPQVHFAVYDMTTGEKFLIDPDF